MIQKLSLMVVFGMLGCAPDRSTPNWMFQNLSGEVIQVQSLDDMRFYLDHTNDASAPHHCSPWLWLPPWADSMPRTTSSLMESADFDVPYPLVSSYKVSHSLKDKLKTWDTWQLNVDALVDLGTRYHTTQSGVEASQVVATLFEGAHPDISVRFVNHEGSQQRSVIATLRGELEEKIILGAHLDSISTDTSVAPGADDDASGIMTLVEVARQLQGVQLRRTLELHAYALEEIGLIGSQQIAQDKENVLAMLQLDMTSFGQDNTVYLVSNSTSPQLRRDLKHYLNTYTENSWKEMILSSGRSDHVSWHNRGIPVAFPFEKPDAYNPKIHTEYDTKIQNHPLARSFGKVALAFVMHYAVDPEILGDVHDLSVESSADLKVAHTQSDLLVSVEDGSELSSEQIVEKLIGVVEVCISAPEALDCIKERHVMTRLGESQGRRVFSTPHSFLDGGTGWASLFAYSQTGTFLGRRQIRLEQE